MQQARERAVAERLTRDMIDGCVGVRVGRLHRLVAREFERHLRPVGLSLQQLEMLSTLTACDRPVKPTVIADLLAVERSTMSRNLAILIERGWAASTDTSPTGRSLAVQITGAGTVKLAEAQHAWHQAQEALIAHLGPDAAATLDTWLHALS